MVYKVNASGTAQSQESCRMLENVDATRYER